MTPEKTHTTTDSIPNHTTIHRRWLALARVVWLVIALVALGTLVAGIPVYFAQLQTVDACRVCGDQRLTLERLHELQTLDVSVRAYAAYYVGIEIALVLVYWMIAMVIFWRKSDDRLALLGAFMLLTWGFAFTNIRDASVDQYPVLWFPVASITWIGVTCLMFFFCLFPDGRFTPRWTRWLVVGWSMFGLPLAFFSESTVEQWPRLLVMPLWIGFLSSVVGVQIYRYRRVSNHIQRQQTKWIVFGMAVGLIGFVALITIGMLFQQRSEQAQSPSMVGIFVPVTALYVCMMLIPLSIGMAILRSRLWEIDVLINRTLVYGALTVTLAVVYIGSVVALQQVVQALTGQQQSQLAIVASTLAIAVLFNPLRRRIQAFIDRRFYRRKYDAAQVLAAFSVVARDEVDLDRLTAELVTVVEETLQPEHVSIWLREPQREA